MEMYGGGHQPWKGNGDSLKTSALHGKQKIKTTQVMARKLEDGIRSDLGTDEP